MQCWSTHTTRCPRRAAAPFPFLGLPREEDDFDRFTIAFGDFETELGVTALAAIVGVP